ncbi:Hypothetical predicted protein [Olea europaea subsp. europaea]|uniref:Uncharacterized protein n=1 Tax=Olea europaea subsp. europaea TaxID=158383 RepID=A0A8S0ULD2_OLEEU|nr:Hypothetical predicted protein [Olea europaea subsp. europaea]
MSASSSKDVILQYLRTLSEKERRDLITGQLQVSPAQFSDAGTSTPSSAAKKDKAILRPHVTPLAPLVEEATVVATSSDDSPAKGSYPQTQVQSPHLDLVRDEGEEQAPQKTLSLTPTSKTLPLVGKGDAGSSTRQLGKRPAPLSKTTKELPKEGKRNKRSKTEASTAGGIAATPLQQVAPAPVKPFRLPLAYDGTEALASPPASFLARRIIDPLIFNEQDLLAKAEEHDLATVVTLLQRQGWLDLAPEPFEYDPAQISAFYFNATVAKPIDDPTRPGQKLNEMSVVLVHDENQYIVGPRFMAAILGRETGGGRFSLFQKKSTGLTAMADNELIDTPAIIMQVIQTALKTPGASLPFPHLIKKLMIQLGIYRSTKEVKCCNYLSSRRLRHLLIDHDPDAATPTSSPVKDKAPSSKSERKRKGKEAVATPSFAPTGTPPAKDLLDAFLVQQVTNEKLLDSQNIIGDLLMNINASIINQTGVIRQEVGQLQCMIAGAAKDPALFQFLPPKPRAVFRKAWEDKEAQKASEEELATKSREEQDYRDRQSE